MLEDLASVMFDEEALKEKCRGLGQQIAKDYEGKDLLVVGILKGSVMFLADLTRNIGIPLHIDFMVASRDAMCCWWRILLIPALP